MAFVFRIMEVYMSLLIYLTQQKKNIEPEPEPEPEEKKIALRLYGSSSRIYRAICLDRFTFGGYYSYSYTSEETIEDMIVQPMFSYDKNSGEINFRFEVNEFTLDVDSLENLFIGLGPYLTGSPTFWQNEKYQNIPHAGCFSNCTQIFNYNEIPDDWK